MSRKGKTKDRTFSLGFSFYALLVFMGLVLIVSTTVWVRSISKSTDRTIERLGEFYLKEIAERNVGNVTSSLNDKVEQMQNACQELNREVLSDEDSVREFIRLVQKINGLDMFALVDEDGMVYTADATFSGISRFDFFSLDNKQTSFHTVESYGTKTMIIIQVPVEVIRSAQIHIVACFSGFNVEKAISVLELQSDENKTYSRMFQRDGKSLIAAPSEIYYSDNFFDRANKSVEFNSGYNLAKIKSDWEAGLPGYTVFKMNDIGQSYMYYKPVQGTDWIITCLMRESNINDVVLKGSEETRKSSINLIIVFVSVFFMIFIVIYMVTQRVKKKEYEREQLQILGALSGDFSEIFIMDPYGERSEPMKVQGNLITDEKKVIRTYTKTWEDYINKYIAPEEQDYVRDIVNPAHVYSVLEDTNEFSFEYSINMFDGPHYVQCRIVKIDGDEDRLIIGFRIIDEQKKAEEQRRLILERALDEAQQANKAKTSFLFNMSHDIRTPMNAIIGFTDLLSEHLDDRERAEKYIKKIQSANEFLLSLINNVLEMARIESGKMTIEEEATDALAVNDSIVSVFEHQFKQKNITFVRSLNVKHENVICDDTKVREIFLNLLSNALKYTPNGGEIHFELTEIESDRPGIAMYQTIVSDNGIGMSQDYLPHLFEEFSRERSSTESKINGTGLGMPIVKKLVILMGGSISVESEVGKGTKFTVVLPHKIIEQEVEHENKTQENATIKLDLSGKRILVAEDNEINIEIVQTILKEAGLEVDVAIDGNVCVEMLEKAPSGYYDMIFMDIQMPNMNGYEATRIIRSMEDKKKNIPIYAMTANAFEEDKREAFAAGMDGHLAKPVKVNEIMETLAKVLG